MPLACGILLNYTLYSTPLPPLARPLDLHSLKHYVFLCFYSYICAKCARDSRAAHLQNLRLPPRSMLNMHEVRDVSHYKNAYLGALKPGIVGKRKPKRSEASQKYIRPIHARCNLPIKLLKNHHICPVAHLRLAHTFFNICKKSYILRLYNDCL